MDKVVQFFYDHAGYSYKPGEETLEQGSERCARELAVAEKFASENGYCFAWSIDEFCDSSEWSDESPPWEQWQCLVRDQGGQVVASLGGIDFGRDGTPWSDPYRRVVEAELALEVMS